MSVMPVLSDSTEFEFLLNLGGFGYPSKGSNSKAQP